MYKIKQIAGYIDMQKVDETCLKDNDEVISLLSI